MTKAGDDPLTGSGTAGGLRVWDLTVELSMNGQTVQLVDGISFDIDPGETVAFVGESGSGKTLTFTSILGLLDPRFRTTGSATFGGLELVGATARQLRSVRGRLIATVFQDPMTSLNPVRRVGAQVVEAVRAHRQVTRQGAREAALALLGDVELPDPEQVFRRFPHELSGGMRQRVMIAIALASEPRLIIADECTTALDVTVQAQIIRLVQRLQRERSLAVAWISHDLAVVAEIAHRVQVMYAGRIVESAAVEQVLGDPIHPYTRSLLQCHPKLEPFTSVDTLPHIPGRPPDPLERPAGCSFWPRCPVRSDPRCETMRPPFREVGEKHFIASFYEARE